MSDFSHHEPCSKCSSTDAFARYTDGSGYCFASGCKHYERSDANYVPVVPEGASKKKKLPELGEYRAIKRRGISEVTCRKMRYSHGEYFLKRDDDWESTPAHIVHVPNQDGASVAAKVRMANKEFRFVGDTKNSGLVFQNIFPHGGLRLVIMEGEIDALSYAEITDCKYACVSLPNGVSNAAEVCARSREYINSFDELILMFDQDAAGKEAAREVCRMFPKAKLAQLPLKDANEMLQAGKGKELVSAVFNAQPWSPSGVLTLASLKEEILKPVEWGSPWAFPTLNEMTFGRRRGELVVLGAGTGIGKTSFLLHQAIADIHSGEEKIAMFLLEQNPVETSKRLAGKLDNKMYHLPPDAGKYTEAELSASVEKLIALDDVFLFSHFGQKDFDSIADNIRWLAITHGVTQVYLDNLTALTAHAQDERRELDKVCEQLASLAQELNIHMVVVSHLTTPAKGSHEEGARVKAREFRGSRSVAMWSHFLLALERNCQHEDPFVRSVTTLRCLKDRNTGQANGRTVLLGFDASTGVQYELSPQEIETYHELMGSDSQSFGGDF